MASRYGIAGYIILTVLLLFLNAPGEAFIPRMLEKGINYYFPHPRYAEGIPYDTKKFREEYDFIIVGGGTAGCVLANRLTEIPGWQVLLLESGGDELFLADIPIFVSYFQLSHINWGFRTEYQRGMCGANEDGRCNWPRGKVLGGSSAINYMIYTRGHPDDYDRWEEQGNRGWGFRDVLKYFKKSENAHISGISRNRNGKQSPFHSSGGYMDVENIPYRTPLADAYVKAAEEIGIKYNPDYNGAYMDGMSYLQVTTRNGSRVSSSKGFLRPIRGRSNLHVAKHSHVTKINIDPKTKEATGVEFLRDGKRYHVRASKEVILSAGALNSPQILMLSGIGPQYHLKEKGIAVIMDAPGVGDNLMDHLSFSGLIHLIDRPYTLLQDRTINLEAISSYWNHHTGPLTVPGGVENIAYITTNISDCSLADVELLIASSSLASDNGLATRRGVGISKDFYNEYFRPIHGRDAWTILPVVLRPRSRGRILLRNADPKAWPLMIANYFDDPRDLDVLVASVKHAKKLGSTHTMKKLGSKIYDRPIPGCSQHAFGSDKYWRCGVRRLTFPLHHQCGTAKMGPVGDKMAVVDDSLRVHGIKRLRVVDASIIPTIVAAHLYAPVLMIAEKASDMIKTTWRSY
ncbi:glucose dehydrogenase [FAD, quinone]-like [Hetaerina americana]|uniref:glucose dehydrogenase [FAD, quinone]-like n=1 Tax=Hetaerina americana TaxID=62018 RepID=UPI003A7F4AA0